ncbi:MAG: hypothetical protein RL641_837 [Candidatus Parcubacteria bacterium]|jgi:prepilin-type N-terminal cleavage/methylation domain-containing protein
MFTKTKLFTKKGFTLIELLVVIAIIASLAVIVFNAINPGKRIKEAQGKSRIQNTQAILDALHTYIVDSQGNLPGVLTAANPGGPAWSSTTGMPVNVGTGASVCSLSSGSTTTIGTSASGCSAGTTACVNLANTTNGIASYLSSNPIDPSGGDTTKTGYQLEMSNGIITVRNCYNGNTPPISFSR